jgi:hypothetical protein
MLQYSLLLSQGFVTAQWYPSCHQHHYHNLTSSTSLRKNKLTLSLGLSLCPSLSRPLCCLQSFSDSHSSVFGHCSRGSASLPDYFENHLNSVDLSLVVPLEILASFECLLATAHVVQPSRLGHHENHLISVNLSLMPPSS